MLTPLGNDGLTPLGTARAAAAISYLLGPFRFSVDDAAPVATTYTEAGAVGSLVFVQNDGECSIASGVLNIPAQTTVAEGDLGFCSPDPITRAAGVALIASLTKTNTSTVRPLIGWSKTSTLPTSSANWEIAASFTTGIFNIFATSPGSTLSVGAYAATTLYRFFAILRATGALLVLDDGTTATLVWPDAVSNSATVYAHMSNSSGVATIDNVQVIELGAPWDSEYGVATDRKAVSLANDTLTMAADAVVEHTFTAQTGVTKELYIRETDTNNRWIIRCSQAGSTVKLIELNGGVETERGSGSQTWTDGTEYRVAAIATGAHIRVSVDIVSKVAYTSATFNQSATQARTDHAGTNFIAWPRVLSGAALTALRAVP